VERRWIGGSCPNIACLPSKNEIWSARIAHQARHAAKFGTVITGAVATDMTKVRQRKRDMVECEIALHLHNYSASSAELIMGSGRFVALKTLEVRLNEGGTRVLAGDHSNSTICGLIWWFSAAAMSASNWLRLTVASGAALA
jgi:pyruvate/2-oxoglutarate dehydrogenase complex dihydrolipoamide dehydrogenase (E3) component